MTLEQAWEAWEAALKQAGEAYMTALEQAWEAYQRASVQVAIEEGAKGTKL